MSKKNNGLTGLEKYLLEEIGVEFKACIYFFCYLFFYRVRLLQKGHFGGDRNSQKRRLIMGLLQRSDLCISINTK